MQSTSNIYFPIFICSFFFDDAGLYALQISICSNKSRGEPESNPGVPGQQRISPPLGLSNISLKILSEILDVIINHKVHTSAWQVYRVNVPHN